MIKIFTGTDTIFTSMGDGVLNAISCKETKVLGEDWYVEIEAGIEYKAKLIHDAIVIVPTPYGNQPFRINNPEVGKKIKFKAYHVGYDTKNYVLDDTSTIGLNCQNALNQLLGETTPVNAFTAYSDIVTTKTIAYNKLSLYQALQSVASEYGGFLDFDGWQIKITSSLGSDNGVELRYGKNLESALYTPDWSEVVTRLKPIGNNGLIGDWIVSSYSYSKPYAKVVEFDADDTTELTTLATDYLALHEIPKVNYRVVANDPATPKYRDISTMLDQSVTTTYGDALSVLVGTGFVYINDVVKVVARQFTVLANILSYRRNVLGESYELVEFGNYRPTVKNMFETLKATVESQTLRKAQVKIDEVNGNIQLIAANEVSIQVGLNNTGIISLASALWEQGGFDSTTGAPVTSTARLRTIARIPVVAGTTYYFSLFSTVEWDFMYAYFDSSGTYISGSPSWVTAKTMGTVAPAGATTIWVSLRKDAFTTITVSDLSTIKFSATTEKVVGGASYNFAADKARFYGDGQEWYDDSGVLQVYFDTVNHRYVFKGRIETTSAEIAGWLTTSSTIYKGGVKLDSANERIYVGNSAYLYSYGSSVMGLSGNLRVAGTITSTGVLSAPTVGTSELIVDFGGTQYRLTRDASGFVKATTTV